MKKKPINVLSLFDGISCGLQSLKELNVSINKYYASEIDADAIAISSKNHPEIIRIGDVNNVDFNKFKDVDLLLAGSPCQGFSSQGKVLGFNDPRSFLFYKFVEALRTIKPKYFLLENVKMKKEWIDIINKEVGIDGYMLSSKYFSAQDRKRYYWTNIPFEKVNINDYGIKFKDIIEVGNNDFISDAKMNIIKKSKWNTTKTYLKNAEKYTNDRFPTIWGDVYMYGNVPLVKIGDKYRLLSIIECERLQTLPDGYTYLDDMSNTQRYNVIKNGWNVETIKYILSYL